MGDGTYPIETKQCARCRQPKPLVEYVLSGLSSDLAAACKPCRVTKRARENERKSRRYREIMAAKSAEPLPERVGERVLVSRELVDREVGAKVYKHVRVRCEGSPECGDVSYVRENLWRNGTCGDLCRRCAARRRNLSYERSYRRTQRVSGERISRMHGDRMKQFALTPWSEDFETQRLVAENPHGMTLEQVGEHLGCTRERVRQIEAMALRRLRLALERDGYSREDFSTDDIRTALDALLVPRSTPNRRAA